MDTTSQGQAANNKLFVGNLNYAVTSDDLRELFSQYGNVIDCIVLSDKFSGRSKGFGFVTFETDDEAEAAKAELNEKEFQGRNLSVSTARPPRPREDRGFGGGNRGGGSRGGFGGGSRGGNDRRGGGGYSRGGGGYGRGDQGGSDY